MRRLLPFVRGPVKVPSPNDVRAARASRTKLYRLAAAAYDNLRGVERLDKAALDALLTASLVGPIERWRQFELALVLAMAHAISKRTGDAMSLKGILPGTADSVVDVGQYGIRWQRAGPGYAAPILEKWEARESAIIREYGISPGYERPDVVVFDRRTDTVVALGEAKYFENDDWRDRLRDAVGQVVSYARGYESKQPVDPLIGRSLIALWAIADKKPEPIRTDSPWITTFDEMGEGLDKWVARAIP